MVARIGELEFVAFSFVLSKFGGRVVADTVGSTTSNIKLVFASKIIVVFVYSYSFVNVLVTITFVNNGSFVNVLFIRFFIFSFD